jgi:DNA-binding GntR family transcriptional regulator
MMLGKITDVPRGPQRPSAVIVNDLRHRIAAGEWRSGEQLPTMGDLAEHYHVARATVARAVKVLADEGLVTVVPGWGTFRT